LTSKFFAAEKFRRLIATCGICLIALTLTRIVKDLKTWPGPRSPEDPAHDLR